MAGRGRAGRQINKYRMHANITREMRVMNENEIKAGPPLFSGRIFILKGSIES